MGENEEKEMEPNEKTTGIFLSGTHKKEYLVESRESTETSRAEKTEACKNNLSDVFDDFTCSNPGENSFATNPTGLSTGHYVSINKSGSLFNIIEFNDLGCVFFIYLQEIYGSIYQYQLVVTARGPMGALSGFGRLHFTDQTGDTYSLSIWDSTTKDHTLSYNSDRPKITTITWSN